MIAVPFVSGLHDFNTDTIRGGEIADHGTRIELVRFYRECDNNWYKDRQGRSSHEQWLTTISIKK